MDSLRTIFLTCQPQHSSTYSKTLHYLTNPSGLLAVGGEQVEVGKRAKLWPNWRQRSLRRASKCCISPASSPIRSLTHHASHMPQLLKHPQMSGQQNAMICHGCICESERPSMSFSCCCQGAQSQKNNIAVERSSDLPKSSIHQPFCPAALQLPSFPSTNNCV